MSKLSILIVEDEAIVAEDLANKIQQLGYDVAGTTATGEEAVELARRLRPALVLMDIHLAGAMDGITAAEQIHRESKLPVLFLTAHSDTSTVERAQQAGALGYILKPFDERDLRIQIEMAIIKHSAEQKLRESEERLALAVSAAQIGMFDRNLASGRTLWTQISKAIFGYAPATKTTTTTATTITEHDQREWTDRVHPEDLPLIREESLRCMREHKPLEVQYRIIWPEGSMHWVETKAVFLYDNNDTANRLLGVVMDITERKRAEEEREATVEFLRFTNESSGTKELIHAATAFFQKHSGCEAVGIRLKDEDDYPYYETRGFPDEFVLAEKRLCARDGEGRPIRDSVGNPVLECMCGNIVSGRFDPSKPFFTAQGSFWSNCTTELLASTSEADRQVRTRNRCNGEGYESVALIPLQLGTERLGLLQLNDRNKGRFTLETITLWERLTGYLAVALAKCRADEAVLRAKEEWEGTFDSVSDMIAIISNEHKFLRVNEAMAKALGIKTEECVGLHCHEAIHGTSCPPEICPHLRTIADGREHAAELHIERLGGDFLITTTPLKDKQGKHIGSVHIAHDITERKRAEKKLQALNEELEMRVEERTLELQETQKQYLHAEKLSAIGKLSASIAHEFNNPLQGVTSILNGLKKRAILEEEDKELLDAAISESNRMKNLIQSLQDFNRPSSGRKAVMDVHSSLDSILLLHRSDFNGKQISVVRNYAENLPHILVVPDQIKQVFLNLLTNAADACDKRCCVITVSTWKEKERVAVAIKDTGIGIKPSEMEHIFRPFFTTKPEVKGTGLGLSVSYGIIKKHNGEIRVESQPGEGATFTVLLPIKGTEETLIATD